MASSKANTTFASSLYKAFFDDDTLSDLTIHLNDRAVRVYRIVLCRQSDYFTKLLTGQFQVRSLLDTSRSYDRKYELELIQVRGEWYQRSRTQRRRSGLDGCAPSLHLSYPLR
jgi:hypothetical protein